MLNKDMKIMFYTSTMRKGGGERVIANLANYFSKDNEVLIVSTFNTEAEYRLNKNIKFVRFDNQIGNSGKRFSYKKFKELKNCIKDNMPDVIISFFPEPCFRLLSLKLMSKYIKSIPIIITERNDPEQEYSNFVVKIVAKYLYSKANGIVFQTEGAKNFFNKKIKNKSIIIPNPVNPEFNIEPYLENREKKIVTVGRLVEQKNQKFLIDVFKELKRDDYILEIYGGGHLYDSLNNYIKDLGLDKKIFLMGKTDKILEKIYKSSLFVLPSKYEGMPNALMEAMALGLPCIATDCPSGGTRYLIKNNVNGILIDIDNKEQMLKAMKKILDDKEYATKLGNNAKKSMEKFTIESVAKKWEKYIYEIKTNEK